MDADADDRSESAAAALVGPRLWSSKSMEKIYFPTILFSYEKLMAAFDILSIFTLGPSNGDNCFLHMVLLSSKINFFYGGKIQQD